MSCQTATSFSQCWLLHTWLHSFRLGKSFQIRSIFIFVIKCSWIACPTFVPGSVFYEVSWTLPHIELAHHERSVHHSEKYVSSEVSLTCSFCKSDSDAPICLNCSNTNSITARFPSGLLGGDDINELWLAHNMCKRPRRRTSMQTRSINSPSIYVLYFQECCA